MKNYKGKNNMSTKLEHLINRLSDSVGDLLYDDRKEDEDLPLGAFEAVVLAGEITVQEIVNIWAAELRDGLRARISPKEIENLKGFY